MSFLGGLLKFLAVLILIGATVLCTAVAIMAEVTEAYLVMGLVWVCALFVTLNIWGTGIALSRLRKLEKKIQQLEQNGRPASVGRFSAPEPVGEETYAPNPGRPAAPDNVHDAAPAKKSNKGVLAAVIAAVAVVAVVICLILLPKKGTQEPAIDPNQGDVPVHFEVEPTEAIPGAADVDAINLGLGDTIDHGGFSMSLDSVELLDEYSYDTSEYSSTSLYVEDGYKLLMLKGHFVNLSTGAISESTFHRSAVVNGTYEVDGFDVRMNFLRSKSYEIDAYTDLDYVVYINIPDKLAEMYENVTFTIGFNDDLSIPVTEWHMDGTQSTPTDYVYAISAGGSYSGGMAEPAPMTPEDTVNTIAIGETIITDDFEFTLRNVELTYEVLPPNTSSVYTSYAAESGKVYVHIEADVKNTMQRDIRIDELFESSVLYDGKYPYSGFTVVNDGDNRFDWVGSYVAATPLETCRAHGLIECPVEVDTSGKSIVVTLELGDSTYEFVLR